MTKLHTKENTHSRICWSAVKLFSSKGYHKTTMDDIATEAGLTKGAIYWHFKNKRALFKHLVMLSFNELDGLISSALSTGITPPAKILAAFKAGVDYLENNRNFCVLIKVFHLEGTILIDEELEGMLRTVYKQYRDKLTATFRQGVAEGYFSAEIDPIIAGALIMAVYDGISLQWLIDPSAFSLQEVIPVVSKLIENGFR